MRAPDFWRSGRGPAPRLLAPLAALYAAGGAARLALTRPRPAPLPSICVGNLVAGGAGKTPVVLGLAAALRRLRPTLRVQFAARGYGGREVGPLRVDPGRHDAAAVGDEALLLATAGPTWIGRDRPAVAGAARRAGAELLIFDDGFQDPSLRHGLALLVFDGGYGVGSGRVMPAGPLREPAGRGLARADAVVLIGPDRAGVAALAAGRPLLRARLEPTAAAMELAGRAVFAFAGIGRPEKFFATLAEMGCRVAGTRAFPDHHRYRPAEILAICKAAAAAGAVPVTTEKDAVRLPAEARPMVTVLPVALVWDEPDAVDALLRRLLPPESTSPGSVPGA